MLIRMLVNNVAWGWQPADERSHRPRLPDKRACRTPKYHELMKYNSRSITAAPKAEPELLPTCPQKTADIPKEDGKRLYIHLFALSSPTWQIQGLAAR